MTEAAEVLAGLTEARSKGIETALATIVSIKGSTYRRPGARLLVYRDAPSAGNLSGGCLEGEVESLGREVMQDRKPRTVTYDLTADDEAVWGWGLGCNGVIEVFIEPGEAAAEVAGAMRAAIEEERPVAVATVISEGGPAPVGARLLMHPDGRTEGAPGPEAAGLAEIARRALQDGATRVVDSGAGRVFVEVLEPPPRVLLCGAGHDAIPLCAAVAAMGWRACVVDDRPDMLDEQRFPGATALYRCSPEEVAAQTLPDARTYAVVMSHNYLRDRAYLGALLGSGAAYIGMLGPAARLQRLLDDLAGQGVHPAAEDLARIHGPAGLDVGAEGPEEIAVAIAAELLAVHAGRGGGFLRDRGGPIHEREPAGSAAGRGVA